MRCVRYCATTMANCAVCTDFRTNYFDEPIYFAFYHISCVIHLNFKWNDMQCAYTHTHTHRMANGCGTQSPIGIFIEAETVKTTHQNSFFHRCCNEMLRAKCQRRGTDEPYESAVCLTVCVCVSDDTSAHQSRARVCECANEIAACSDSPTNVFDSRQLRMAMEIVKANGREQARTLCSFELYGIIIIN